LSGIDAPTASAWAGTFATPADDEADGLEMDPPVAGVEGPVAIEHEVVDDGDEPRGDRRKLVVDPDRVHAQRVDGEVDDKPEAADEAEAHQLQPVGGLAQTVQQAHMRTDLNRSADIACVDVHGCGLVAHRCRLAERHRG